MHISDATTKAAFLAATNQADQCAALVTGLGVGNVTVQFLSSGGAVLAADVYGAASTDTTTDPANYGVALGVWISRTFTAAGSAVSVSIRRADGTEIVTDTIASGHLTISGPIGNGNLQREANSGVRLLATHTLPLTPLDVTGPSALPTTMTILNGVAATSPGFIRLGLPFRRGDVVTGHVPVITRSGSAIAAQFDERAFWDDGSLKFCVAHIRDTTFTASESRVYTIDHAAGTYSNTGTKTLSDITGANTFTMSFTNVKQADDSIATTATPTVTRGSGTMSASFTTHSATSTRVTKIHNGSVCEGWMVWGMALDGATPDDHLKTVWYIDLWKNADGSTADIEYGAVVTMDWWAGVGTTKQRLQYDAALKNGATTIQTYSTVGHPYHSQWLTAQPTGTDNAGRRFWKTATPTLVYQPNRAYWNTTGLIPPIDPTYAFGASPYTSPYVPCQSMDHRAGIDSTGGFMGRGPGLSCVDAIAIGNPTAANMRSARVNALAGLSLPLHYRSNATRTRPSESADIANSTLPQKCDPMPTSDWTAYGLPASDYFYADARAAAGGYVAPKGGALAYINGVLPFAAGVWGISYQDSSHAVPYSYGMYLLEGERYHLESTHDRVNACNCFGNKNEYGGWAALPWYYAASVRTALGIPSTLYSNIACVNTNPHAGNVRTAGFGSCVLAGVAVTPSDHEAYQYWQDTLTNASNYLAAAVTYHPSNLTDAGVWVDGSADVGGDHSVASPWMQAIIAVGFYRVWESTRKLGFRSAAAIPAKLAAARLSPTRVYSAETYRALGAPTAEVFDLTANPWFSAATQLTLVSNAVPFTSNTGTMSWTGGVDGASGMELANGDTVYFTTKGPNFESAALPSGYTAGTKLYVINASGATFKLSTTAGGSVFTVPNGSYRVAVLPAAWGNYTVTQFPPYKVNADSFTMMNWSALVMAKRNGHPDATSSLLTSAATFIAPVDSTAPTSTNYGSAWRLAV